MTGSTLFVDQLIIIDLEDIIPGGNLKMVGSGVVG
jgi:hypothetical protein